MPAKISSIISVFVVLCCLSGVHAAPNSTELYRTAEKLALSGDFDRAIQGFQKTLEINPYYSLAHYGLGKACLYRENMLEQAVYHLEKAVDLDKELARGYFYLGIGYMFKKRFGESINAFLAAYERDRDLVEALYNLAVVYDLIKQEWKAVKLYDRYLLEKNKRDSDILF